MSYMITGIKKKKVAPFDVIPSHLLRNFFYCFKLTRKLIDFPSLQA